MSRSRAALAIAAAASFLLTACTDDPSTETSPTGSPTITVGLTYIPDVQFAPFYVALEHGYFADEGVDVTLRHHGSQESLFGALEAGKEQVVFAGGDEMMQARSAGIDVVNFATMYQEYPVVLIVREESDIHSNADIAGKTIGLPGEFGENYFGLLAMLDDAGLADSDLTIQYIGYTQMAALGAGHVDGVIGFVNNEAVAMESQGLDVRTVPLTSDDLPLVGVGLGASSTTLSTNPAELAAIVRAVDSAVEFCQDDPEACLDAAAKHVPALSDPSTRESARATLTATLPLYAGGEGVGAQDAEAWTAMSSFMDGAGLLTEPVPADEAFTVLTGN